MHPSLLLLLAGIAGFVDLDDTDRQVAAFVAASSPSASAQPLDRRLHLAPCPVALTIGWFGTEHRAVLVQCPVSGINWRVYVPVSNAAPAILASGDPGAAPIVQRGDEVTVIVTGEGFSISRSAEALEAGTRGQWIKVRGPGGEPLRARITSPGQVELGAR